MNISAVLTSTITDDLGVTTNQVNVGSQLLSAGIVVTEIPSNIVLQWLGPQRWLSAQLFAWGLVATFQAFVQSYPAYLATRLLLGMLEGGFIPGALYYLSTWYKRDETSFRTTLFFFGQMFAGATASLISAGLLTLDGKGGLAGWRWVWLGISPPYNRWAWFNNPSGRTYYHLRRDNFYPLHSPQSRRRQTVDQHGPLELLYRARIPNNS